MNNKKLKILVLEDEKSLKDVITMKLNTMGMGVAGFESVQEAIDYLKGLTNVGELPDLIWLDYYLKDLNGMDFMKELKKYNNLNKIPVIVVSNSASPQKVQDMLDMGAKKYILKAENKLEDIVKTIYEFAGK